MLIPALYGIASAATIWFAALSLRERDAKTLAAIVLFAGWMTYNLSNEFSTDLFWPIMDALFGAIFATMWIERPSTWKARVFACLMLQCVCHVAYHLALAFDVYIGYGYTAALNALFLCQLLIVSNDGMRRGWNLFSDWCAAILDRNRGYGIGASTRKAK